MSKFVTVIVPTRNRTELLADSINSFKYFTFPNFKVIISNNSEPEKKSQTREIIKDLIEKESSVEFKYVEPPNPMGMSDHWEFCMQYVQGDYFYINCDDDVLGPNCLEDAVNFACLNKLESVVWQSASYYFQEWPNSSYRNSIEVFPTENKSRLHFSKSVLSKFFNIYWPDFHIPKALNGITSVSLMKQIQKKTGRFFFVSNPDASAAVNTLTNTEYFGILGGCRSLSGCSPSSGAFNATNLERIKKFIDEYDCDLLEYSPSRIPVTASLWADSMYRTLAANKKTIKDDKKNFYQFLHANLLYIKNNGFDVSALIYDWEKEVTQKFPKIDLKSRQRTLLERIFGIIKNPYRIINKFCPPKVMCFKGSAFSFEGIAGAGQFLQKKNIFKIGFSFLLFLLPY